MDLFKKENAKCPTCIHYFTTVSCHTRLGGEIISSAENHHCAKLNAHSPAMGFVEGEETMHPVVSECTVYEKRK